MLKKLKNRNEGFTIVETLIVLAIAGLIILIVLLAVPALQRSSQNSNIKSDAEAVSSEINDYESNNDGLLPTGVANATGVLTVSGTGTSSTGKVQPSDTVNFQTSKAASPTYATPGTATSVGPNDIIVDAKETCPSTSVGGTALTASPSAIAVFYPINDGNATAANNGVGCLQS